MLTLTLALTLTLTLTLGEHQLNEGVRARRRDAPGSPHLALPSFPPSSPGHGTRDGGPSRAQELDEAFATMVANAKRYNDEGSQVAADADVLGTAYADGRARLFAEAAKLEPLPRGGGR